MIAHISMGHPGELIDEQARATLASWGRAVCASDGCGAIRDPQQPICKRCKRSAATRAFIAGDQVPTLRVHTTIAASQDAHDEADDLPGNSGVPASSSHGQQPSDELTMMLPADFAKRVRSLPCTTVVGIPYALRARICEITAELLERMNAGDAAAGLLEESRSKLLLSPVPRGASRQHELRTRVGLWEAKNFEVLLKRIEEQRAASCGRRSAAGGAQRIKQSRKLACGGARRKAVQALTSDVAMLSPEEQKRWAAELLPGPSGEAEISLPEQAPIEPSDHLDGGAPSPLKGIRFGPLSGPGPSGARPEHLQDMLACGRRRSANRLLNVLRAMEALAEAGRLPDAWGAILRTRLVFLRKRHGTKPRPVRIGELWRRLIAKHVLAKAAMPVRQAMLRAQQYAVMLPGGAEPLIHARRCFRESVLEDPALGVWCEVDSDLVNAYCSLEWGPIAAAVREETPEISRWTEWCQKAAPIILPDGSEHLAGRGAEQGDPCASAQCGAVIACARKRWKATLAATSVGPSFAFDLWFAGDGQIYVRPDRLDSFLKAMDAELAKAGCTRGEVPDAKSAVTLIGHPDAIASAGDTWLTPYVIQTCKVRTPNGAAEVLGAVIGSDQDVIKQFDDRVRTTGELHSAIEGLADPAIELTLGRSCADVARIGHLLRASGDVLADGPVSHFDLQQIAFLERICGGELGDAATAQAALGIRAGGLGLRTAKDLALASFVASRVESAPLVAHIFAGMAAEGIPTEGAQRRFDTQLADAKAKLVSVLGTNEQAQMNTLMADGERRAQERFEQFRDGRNVSGHPVRETGDVGPHRGIVAEAGTEDPEHSRTIAVPRLQRRLSAVMDEHRAALLAERAVLEGRGHDFRRIKDISDPTVSHDWLWSLAPTSSQTLEPDVYVDAVRLRLGAACAPSDARCQVCGSRARIDGTHALCCAPGPSTTGHNEVRDRLLALARRGDPHAEKEASGLLPVAPGRRPADVLTRATGGNGLAALDVGIASPDSRLAIREGDGLEAMRKRKKGEYLPFADALAEAGVSYCPLLWSCWGREHADTSAMVE